jgi:hypothetical protein
MTSFTMGPPKLRWKMENKEKKFVYDESPFFGFGDSHDNIPQTHRLATMYEVEENIKDNLMKNYGGNSLKELDLFMTNHKIIKGHRKNGQTKEMKLRWIMDKKKLVFLKPCKKDLSVQRHHQIWSKDKATSWSEYKKTHGVKINDASKPRGNTNHKNIGHHVRGGFQYKKMLDGQLKYRRFDSLIDALCFKFIHKLEMEIGLGFGK